MIFSVGILKLLDFLRGIKPCFDISNFENFKLFKYMVGPKILITFDIGWTLS